MSNIQDVVKHIVNGTLSESLCRVCLMALDEISESIFTKVCKDSTEYSVAEILDKVCGMKIEEGENSFICSHCFIQASEAYKFFLHSKRSQEIINFYVQELCTNLDYLELKPNSYADSICITLPNFTPETMEFDFNFQGVLTDKIESYTNFKTKKIVEKEKPDSDDEIIVVMDKGKTTCYKFGKNGGIKKIDNSKMEVLNNVATLKKKTKNRRKRELMDYRQCSQCPVQYRFLSKLRDHMLNDHKMELHICKICKAVSEDNQEFQNHLQTHQDTMTCDYCYKVFKRRDKIEAHMKTHHLLNNSELTHVCEHCGLQLENEEKLQDHYEQNHLKKYTCYYCGRMYKREISFEMHIKKHENPRQSDKGQVLKKDSTEKKKRSFQCATCGRNFVDGRALMWHNRLHTNERPYKCETCGRGYVSLNRRNQHAVCAHSAPARRCPLCPALFHLTSMVNTHIKKVHLKSNKRKNRSNRYSDVYWRTEPVQLQDLSVSVQNELLELQTQEELKKPKQKMEGIQIKQNQGDNVYEIWQAV